MPKFNKSITPIFVQNAIEHVTEVLRCMTKEFFFTDPRLTIELHANEFRPGQRIADGRGAETKDDFPFSSFVAGRSFSTWRERFEWNEVDRWESSSRWSSTRRRRGCIRDGSDSFSWNIERFSRILTDIFPRLASPIARRCEWRLAAGCDRHSPSPFFGVSWGSNRMRRRRFAKQRTNERIEWGWIRSSERRTRIYWSFFPSSGFELIRPAI